MWHAMGERNAYEILVGKPEGKNHLEDLGVDVNIRLYLPTEPSGSIKGRELLD
jgi:hypothetical protein